MAELHINITLVPNKNRSLTDDVILIPRLTKYTKESDQLLSKNLPFLFVLIYILVFSSWGSTISSD